MSYRPIFAPSSEPLVSSGMQGFKSQLSYLLAMRTWAHYLSLRHQFSHLQKGFNSKDNDNNNTAITSQDHWEE